MEPRTFHLKDSTDFVLWVEQVDGVVRFYQREKASATDTVLLEISVDALRNILVWADEERGVTASMTGPMAALIKKHAQELGFTEEMFVWHAVKVFIEVGTS